MKKFFQKILTLWALVKLFFSSGEPFPSPFVRSGFRAPDGSIRLAFCGKMKSGKDTAAGVLAGLKGGTIVHIFASGYRFTEWLMLYPLFGQKIDPDNKTKFERLALQWVGHWGRVVFGKDVWLKRTLKLINKTKGNVYVVGVRYPNEVQKLREINVQSVWIDRPEAARIAAGAFNLDHETETALDAFTAFDYRIPNDKDLATFRRRVECYAHIGTLLDKKETWDHRERLRVENTENNVMGASLSDDPADNVHLLTTNGWQPPTDGDFFRGTMDSVRQIAQEIRRFSHTIEGLKVTDPELAVKSVRDIMHKILDNRPIDGCPYTEAPRPLTREEKLDQIQALAADLGEELLIIDHSKSVKVKTFLEGEDRKQQATTMVKGVLDLLASPKVEAIVQSQTEARARAKRDRYNVARKQRRAEQRARRLKAIERMKKEAKKVNRQTTFPVRKSSGRKQAAKKS